MLLQLKRAAALLTAVVIAAAPMQAAARDYSYIPYEGYAYNRWDEAVPAAVAYQPDRYIQGDREGKAAFSSPVDLFVDGNGRFYILNEKDAGVVVLDREQNLVAEIKELTLPDGSVTTLMDPQGIYVKDDTIYIADLDQEAVLICDLSGKVSRKLTKPEKESYPQDKLFRPQKVLVDGANNVYVLLEGIYQGAATFDSDGVFTEFFGSNKVEVTASLLSAMFWRNFMTDEQIDSAVRSVPVEYTNFDIDKDNFIYTCTATNDTSTDELRKLNAVGDNILPSANYGDLETTYFKNRTLDTRFLDVCVNEDGFIFGLDGERGRVFVYDNEGEPVFIFGGMGAQLGRFQEPVAIEDDGQSIYVLDKTKNAIAVFSLTRYGRSVYDATVAFMDGRYTESKQMWSDVIMQNANCLVGYVGIGKALYQTGEYKEAMKYFKLGGSQSQESRAYTDLRKTVMRQYTGIGITVLVVLLAAWWIFRFVRRRRRRRADRSE